MGIIAIITPGTTLTRAVPGHRSAQTRYQVLETFKSCTTEMIIRPLMMCNTKMFHQWCVKTLQHIWMFSGKLFCYFYQHELHGVVSSSETSVLFLPMIDMSLSDPSCIYSTLSYVAHHEAKYNFKPIITFDQPLWWKALAIIQSQPDASHGRMVVRLGAFHMAMSFIGSIGHLKSSSWCMLLMQFSI